MQTLLNKMACLFYGKTALNAHPPIFANEDFTFSAECIDPLRKNIRDGDCQLLCINYGNLNYIHQQRIWDCADTSVAMVMNFHREHIKQEPLASSYQRCQQFFVHYNQRTILSMSGKSFDDLLRYSPALQYEEWDHLTENRAFWKGKLAFILYQFGPIVVSLNEIGGHFVVLKGIVEDQVIFHDPWSGPNLTYSLETFLTKWEKTVLYFNGGFSKKIESNNTNLPNPTPSLRQGLSG